MSSCEKDNYDPPSTTLSGRLVYQGEPIGVERDQVSFELYQYGFGKVGPIGQTFAQDGSYSALLFNGEYKMVIPIGQGPFLSKVTGAGAPDSVSISLTGNQAVDVEVTPYYMIRNAQIAASGGNVTSTFSIEKIVTDVNAKDIENVALYVNKTQFVSGADNIANVSIAGADITDPSNVSLQVAIPSITPAQNYVFARIGLQIAGVEDRIFSPLVKVQF
jgi:hypothetical protein